MNEKEMEAIVDRVMEYLRDQCPTDEVTRDDYTEILEMLVSEIDTEASLS